MSSMKDVKQAMRQGDYMASLDLTDCFWGLPLAEKDQRACAFHWRGKNYVFRCLPFGLSLRPLFITKLYRHVVEHLQARARGSASTTFLSRFLSWAQANASASAACRRCASAWSSWARV